MQACFKFTPLAPNIPGALVEITGVIKAQAIKPNEGFEYHIHEKPVGPDNDCMATGGHLDPLKFGDGHCNPATPDKCQEGDLSGNMTLFCNYECCSKDSLMSQNASYVLEIQASMVT